MFNDSIKPRYAQGYMHVCGYNETDVEFELGFLICHSQLLVFTPTAYPYSFGVQSLTKKVWKAEKIPRPFQEE